MCFDWKEPSVSAVGLRLLFSPNNALHHITRQLSLITTAYNRVGCNNSNKELDHCTFQDSWVHGFCNSHA